MGVIIPIYKIRNRTLQKLRCSQDGIANEWQSKDQNLVLLIPSSILGG